MQKLNDAERLDLLVLAWLWCQRGKPATAANLATGLKAIAPADAAKTIVPASLERLAGAGQVERVSPATKKGKASFKVTEAGIAKVSDWLCRKELPAGRSPFGSISSYELPAIASGLPIPSDAKLQKALAKLLPLDICSRKFELPIPLNSGPEAAKLELVKIALSRSSHVPVDRIYLKKLPGGVLPAIVVGPLLGEPGTAAADLDKLLAASACKILGGCKPAQLKAEVVRRWFGGAVAPAASQAAGPVDVQPAAAVPVAADAVDVPAIGVKAHPSADVATAHQQPEGAATATATATATAAAPPTDGAAFSRDVLAAARAIAHTGGPGVSTLGDKVLIYYVWREYEHAHRQMRLDVFKQRLSDAPVDQLVLVREDLIPAERTQEFKDSEVTTGISTYHYVRVGNLGEHHA